jgi:hypothetical protein
MSQDKKISADQILIQKITDNLDTGRISEATLSTDDRVLARITDGIYRQPASALRELITNAYDADAENVIVETDWPRFSKISVRDDGNGLTIESLASLINHIGGSPKRTKAGVALGVVNKLDHSLSPAGRRLIGKIGIGLFSVAQLTRHFQIITKTRGTDYRLVAEVTLKTYTEDDLATISSQKEDMTYETGTVRIKAFPAEDKKDHGTEIILLDLRPQTKDLLRSKELWMRNESDDEAEPPTYHIGELEKGSEDILATPERLPWGKDDKPEEKFGKLFQAIIDQVDANVRNPKLENVLDNYLRTLWTLSLSAPIDYLENHPFDLTAKDHPSLYLLSNVSKGQTSEIKLEKQEKLRDRVDLTAPERGAKLPFRIVIDEIELRRPIRFNNLPATSQAITKPIVFVGKHSPDLSKIPREVRGGDLSFEAYFLWTPIVVPTENKGLLIRISDASGTGFDDKFMKYQVSELTRLNQITAEIFVIKGLDAALNIDRESFNFAHPHYQILTNWVHNALRQLANTHKALAATIRTGKKAKEHVKKTNEVSRRIAKALETAGVDPEAETPEVILAPKSELKGKRGEGVLAFEADVILPQPQVGGRDTPDKRAERELLEEKVKGVAVVLEAFGAFDGMNYEKQQQLLQSIVSIFMSGE